MPDPDLVTPGTIGFLATLTIVILTIFLIRDALRRVRRIRARSGESDAYPIPLRRHVVPNQSTLSGPDIPEIADSAAETDSSAESDESSASNGSAAVDDETESEVEDHRGGSAESSTDSSTAPDDRH